MLPTVGLYLSSPNEQGSYTAAPQNAAAGVERFSLNFSKYLYTLVHFIISYSA